MAGPIEDLPGEIWKPVVGFEGLYEISSVGRVKSLARWNTRDRILCPVPNNYGYLMVSLSKKGNVTLSQVHRLVLEAFVGPCPEGRICRHLDGCRTNNLAENLRWGTHAENATDREAHGNTAVGSSSGKAKLNERQVSKIKERLRRGDTVAAVARDYLVSANAIGSIKRGKTWRHVK